MLTKTAVILKIIKLNIFKNIKLFLNKTKLTQLISHKILLFIK